MKIHQTEFLRANEKVLMKCVPLKTHRKSEDKKKSNN